MDAHVGGCGLRILVCGYFLCALSHQFFSIGDFLLHLSDLFIRIVVFTVLLLRLCLDLVHLYRVGSFNFRPFRGDLAFLGVELLHDTKDFTIVYVKAELVSSVILLALKLVLVGRVESL